eukprot:c22947_g1_i1.p1 GENE.c22947_g1_i1~~c22947_g1_i1.p1  ORF type:complete len:126 (+),score=16.00 c22947_g1_i1:340-717(+)
MWIKQPTGDCIDFSRTGDHSQTIIQELFLQLEMTATPTSPSDLESALINPIPTSLSDRDLFASFASSRSWSVVYDFACYCIKYAFGVRALQLTEYLAQSRKTNQQHTQNMFDVVAANACMNLRPV